MKKVFGFPELRIENERLQVKLVKSLVRAASIVHRGGCAFAMEDDVPVGEWPNHPDLAVVSNWLAAKSESEDGLEVVYWLTVHVRTEWSSLPKRTLSEHRELYDEIEQLCARLRAALGKTGSTYIRGGGRGLAFASVSSLLTDAEKGKFREAFGPMGGWDSPENSWAFPDVEAILERVESAAKRLRDSGPIHTQPKKRGAERGFFVRRLNQLLTSEFGDVPAEIIAAITSVALSEPTDRELASKLLKER